MKSSRFPILILLALAAASCSKTPRGIIAPDKMSRLLADVYRSEAAIDFNPGYYAGDSMKQVVRQSVFEAHDVTKAEFDSSLVWYGHHIDQYLKVCDNTITILETEMKAIPDDDGATNLMLVAGDSASVWPRERYLHITPSFPTKYLTFKLLPDENWEPGDHYELQFKLINPRSTVKSNLTVDYTDGRSSWVNTSRDDEGWSKVTLILDSTRTAAAIYGLLEFDPVNGEHMYVDSISLIRTRRPLNHRYHRPNDFTFDYGKKQD